MESVFDLDVEHMSAVFVSDDGQLENMLSMSDVFDIFRKCCYSSHAPTSVTNQCLTCSRLSMKLS